MGCKTAMTLAARHHCHLLGVSDRCMPPLLNRLQFSPTTTKLPLDLRFVLRPVSVGISSDFHLHLISCHIGVFDDVATFLRREKN